MFEIEDLLLPAVTSFVPSDTPAVVPKFDRAGIHFRLHLGARRQRDRVCIREHFGAAQTVHRRETRLRQVEAFLG